MKSSIQLEGTADEYSQRRELVSRHNIWSREENEVPVTASAALGRLHRKAWNFVEDYIVAFANFMQSDVISD